MKYEFDFSKIKEEDVKAYYVGFFDTEEEELVENSEPGDMGAICLRLKDNTKVQTLQEVEQLLDEKRPSYDLVYVHAEREDSTMETILRLERPKNE